MSERGTCIQCEEREAVRYNYCAECLREFDLVAEADIPGQDDEEGHDGTGLAGGIGGVTGLVFACVVTYVMLSTMGSLFPTSILEDEEEIEWSIDDFPREKVHDVVLESRSDGHERGFYFCSDGRTGEVARGTESSIKNHTRVSIDCGDARTGFLHTHPEHTLGSADLSFGDHGVGEDEEWWANCVANLAGTVYCEVQGPDGDRLAMSTAVDVDGNVSYG